jgi:hypothetical protein
MMISKREEIKPHAERIADYVATLAENPKKSFGSISKLKMEKELLEKYFVEGWKVSQISDYYGISGNTLTNFYNDYILENYDDSQIEAAAIIDAENHLGIMATFFSGAFYIAREMALASILARKLREEIAQNVSKYGAAETLKDKDLMRAWTEVTGKLDKYGSMSIKQTETYLNLMEKVLDKQREVAFVKILFDLFQKADPSIIEKVNKALEEDEYAKAVLESLSGEALIKTFRTRKEAATIFDPDSFERLQEDIVSGK